ncbi:penicillin-binding transpeptidase domain-containing protein [Flavihumibacter sp. ZG627]|uniref:penicillin-binding transpeptidase domain-containing protein n=1 Tax=Flavihumibacter sp. ZG627 TaxID=1463156 RepID=UPI00209E1C03|nr:penicillin-binding transpeptidase domain-containing protein [Flavihumibacter sp. ZG627]
MRVPLPLRHNYFHMLSVFSYRRYNPGSAKQEPSLFSIPLILFSVLVFTGCAPNNVEENKELEKYFAAQKVTGVFGMFDNGLGSFIISDKKHFRDSAFLPASTFKVVNALVGLESGVLKDDSVVIAWDGIKRPIESWNQDLSLYRAFRFSSVPYFQELARRIGKDSMQLWLDTLGYAGRYGRAVISQVDSFWLDGSIKITPDEQLGLMKKLYFDQLPFQRRSNEMVRKMMLMEDNSNYKLSYKTGWGKDANGDSIGWIIGWIEENRHPYFFVLQLRTPDPAADIPAIRLKVLKDILAHLGFLKGEK